MRLRATYNLLSTFGFFALAGGLLISKFAVSVGVSILVLLLPLVYYLNEKKFDKQVFSLFIPLILVYMWLVMSSLYSSDKSSAFQQLFVQNGLLSIPIILSFHWDQFKRNCIKICHFLFAVGILSSVITIAFYFMAPEVASEWTQNLPILQEYPDVFDKTQFGLYSPFIDRLHFAYGLGFCALSGAYLSFVTDQWYYKVITSFFVFMILFMGARGAQIALLLASVPMLILYLKMKFPELQILSWHSVVFSVIFLVSVPILSYELMPSVQKRYDQMRWELQVIKDGTYINHDYKHFTTLTRLKSIEYSWDIVNSKPLFGTGIGDVTEDLKELFTENTPDIPTHHQNFYIYLWMAGGLAALILFIWFLLNYLKTFLRSNTSFRAKSFAVSYLIFLVIVLMIDAPMKYHLGAFGIPFLIGMTFAFSLSNDYNVDQ